MTPWNGETFGTIARQQVQPLFSFYFGNLLSLVGDRPNCRMLSIGTKVLSSPLSVGSDGDITAVTTEGYRGTIGG